MEWKKKDHRYFLRLEKGEEIIEKISEFCEENKIIAGAITGIGAVNQVEFGLFDTIEKKYHTNCLNEALEITSLIGNISRKEEKVYLHLHITVGNIHGLVYGGHLNKAVISATGEIIIDEADVEINRRFDETIGLNLWEF